MYADAQGQPGAAADAGDAAQAESAKKDDDNVVDAEFTEVKDKKTG
jgi:molecular chaperone DnaK